MELTNKLPVFDQNNFVGEINGKKCATIRSFYGQIAKALHFPDYFGKNLDALDECLADLSWIEQENAVLIIQEAHEFLKKEKPEKREAVLDIFNNITENPGDKQFQVLFAA